MNDSSQNRAILQYLESGGSLSTIDALEKFGSFRLSARINNLRNKGHNIKTEKFKTPSGKTVARYFIPEKIQKQGELF